MHFMYFVEIFSESISTASLKSLLSIYYLFCFSLLPFAKCINFNHVPDLYRSQLGARKYYFLKIFILIQNNINESDRAYVCNQISDFVFHSQLGARRYCFFELLILIQKNITESDRAYVCYKI